MNRKITDFLKESFQKWGSFFVINYIIAILVYITFISHNLVNQLDGIWHTAHCYAGDWERTLGRWSWVLFDRLIFGMHFDPLATYLALAILILGLILLLSIFDITPKNKVSYLISLLYICSTSVYTWLSFKYTSHAFMMAFLTSILAIYLIKNLKNHYVAVVLAAASIAVAMGCYQAFINCACLCLLMLLALYFYQNKEAKEIITLFVRGAVSFIAGAILDVICINISLKLNHLELSSYNGASNLSPLYVIKSFPNKFVECFYQFKTYFMESVYRYNYFQDKKVLALAILLVILCYVVLCTLSIWKENHVYAVLFAICCLLTPVACNAVLFIAVDSFVSIQMLTAVALFFPVMLCFVMNVKLEFNWEGYARGVVIFLGIVTLVGNFISVSIDQEVTLEGKTATVNLAENILTALIDDGYIDRGGKVMFVGTPYGNERFYTTDLYPYANDLARFGDWSKVYDANRMTWEGVFREYCGFKLDMAQDDVYGQIVESGLIERMPQFPKQGSIINYDGVTIVKVSDNYKMY